MACRRGGHLMVGRQDASWTAKAAAWLKFQAVDQTVESVREEKQEEREQEKQTQTVNKETKKQGNKKENLNKGKQGRVDLWKSLHLFNSTRISH